MASPEKEKKTKQELLPSPPDDLSLSCFARISRLYHPTLSLVSKIFSSFLASPELYKTRSLLGCTKTCLYVCFQSATKCSWFTLCRKPDQTTQAKSNGYVLAPASTLHTPHAMPMSSGIVAVGSDIYNIGSSSSSRVLILDCRSHTWHEGPSLCVKLHTLSASVVDRKIYVAGVQFYALKNSFKRDDNMRSACLDGKFHVATKNYKVVCYNS
ncbi:hypothetical protein HID58_075088 [Brassica napus]|uniref:F-box domain-containing protein n=1 Tax=Brassica napus TaxID=3708 RepID=A0ABQ7YIT5_BRANA|nr:hypothetical protein HID58_075088 [Brassica napus]